MTDAQRVRQAQREIILLTIILLTTELEPENEGAGEKTERLRDACTEKTYERMYTYVQAHKRPDGQRN